jgi:acylphosphatase
LKTARKYLIRGRVQGVGFRYFVERAADSLGVRGYVRNLEDGRVEVYAVGLPDQLSEFAGMLWKGPRMADVRGVDEDEAPVEKVQGFTTR